jgi:hypothetical protein
MTSSQFQNFKMAKQILETFSVIKNGCLNIEREFFSRIMLLFTFPLKDSNEKECVETKYCN